MGRAPEIMVNAKNSFRITRKTRFLEKSRFSGPFRKKLLSYEEITLMLFRTLPVAPGCNKVSENEKTSGNRYNLWNRARTRAYSGPWHPCKFLLPHTGNSTRTSSEAAQQFPRLKPTSCL
jgi:hypothetical protein